MTCSAWRPSAPSCPASGSCRPRACWSPGRRRACWSTGPWCTAWWRPRAARTSPAACRTTAATRHSRPGTRPRRRTRTAWQRFRAEYLAGDEASYQQAVRRFTGTGRAAEPAAAVSGPGEPARDGRQAPAPDADPGRGLRGGVRRGLARRRRHPGQPDGPDPHPGRPAGPAHLRARPAALRRRGLPARPGQASSVIEGWLPYRSVFTMVAAGRRHVMMGAAQLDRFGNQNISCIGDWARPEGPAARRARRARQHHQPPGQLLGAPALPPGASSSGSTWSAASATTGPRAWAPQAARFHELRVVVTNLAVLDFRTPRITPCGCARCTRASPSATSPPPPASRWPCRTRCRSPGCPAPDELALIRDELDPAGATARPGARVIRTPLTEPARHRLPGHPDRDGVRVRAPGWRRPRPGPAGSASSRRRR